MKAASDAEPEGEDADAVAGGVGRFEDRVLGVVAGEAMPGDAGRAPGVPIHIKA